MSECIYGSIINKNCPVLLHLFLKKTVNVGKNPSIADEEYQREYVLVNFCQICPHLFKFQENYVKKSIDRAEKKCRQEVKKQ